MSASVTDRTSASGYSGIDDHSAPLHSFLEHSTALFFPVLFLLNVYWSGTRLYEVDLLWLLVFAIPLGILGGDFISGVVHWAADTYCSEDTPIVGPSLVKPFRMHHIYPKDICTHNLVATIGNVCILACPVLSVSLILLWFIEHEWLAFAALSVALMAVATVATNQFHKWAHQDVPPAYARPFQRLHLVLDPTHHSKHHTEPYESHYCITNGWLNPVLNRIKFFRRLEGALASLGIQTEKAKAENAFQRGTGAAPSPDQTRSTI